VCCFTDNSSHLLIFHAGITKGLKELEADLNDDLESGAFKYSSIDKDEKLRLINQLLEHRHQTRTSMRATMKSAQINASNTAERIGNEVRFLVGLVLMVNDLIKRSSWTFLSARVFVRSRVSRVDMLMTRRVPTPSTQTMPWISCSRAWTSLRSTSCENSSNGPATLITVRFPLE
jgi:hypothetical protein